MKEYEHLECCDTCKWWRQAKGHSVDQCMFHAPRPSLGDDFYTVRWPLTAANDFCSQHNGDFDYVSDFT